jgi:hypothetical protein
MGMSYYLALRAPGAEAARHRDLSSLAMAADQLDLLCGALQVTPMKAFVSRWHRASHGLHTCQTMLEALMSNHDPLPHFPSRSTDWLSEDVLQEQVRLLGLPPEIAAATRELLSRPLGLRIQALPGLLDDLEYLVSWLVQYPDASFRVVALS